MLRDLLVPLAILPDNVLVTLDTRGLHAINVQVPITVQVVFVQVRKSSHEVLVQSIMIAFSL